MGRWPWRALRRDEEGAGDTVNRIRIAVRRGFSLGSTEELYAVRSHLHCSRTKERIRKMRRRNSKHERTSGARRVACSLPLPLLEN